MKNIERYTQKIEAELQKNLPSSEAHKLFTPLSYIINLGGKRIRPALCLMCCELFNGDLERSLPSSLAIELFHNFSLIHDDIMDKAPLRRGQATVHEKWNSDQAILSGDAMLVLAYQMLEKSQPAHLPALFTLFNTTSMEVCEGQQLDMEFENRNDVHIDEYVEMIRLKTSVLIGASLKMGAICANQDVNQQNKMYSFGEKLGIAFQLRDDYLDAFSDDGSSGKQVGGDILANKKTFLLIRALEIANQDQRNEIESLIAGNKASKVDEMIRLFKTLGVDLQLNREIESYSSQAIEELNQTDLSEKAKEIFRDFAFQLMTRVY